MCPMAALRRSFVKDRKTEVFLSGCLVGYLAETADHRVAFAYAEPWLEEGFPISPFSLPLEPRVFVPSSWTFRGLWGVFADSLPDAWGQLLVDRLMISKGISLDTIMPLDRLSIVGKSGMGALEYVPAWETPSVADLNDLDQLAQDCNAVLNHESISDLDSLFHAAGSSGGARPKVMTEDWIIKFPASRDQTSVGKMEKEYMDCAVLCGIDVPETTLFPSRLCEGYFGIRRFDRKEGRKLHMLSAAAILEADWRTASLDYHSLLKLANILSRGRKEEVEQLYRRMCFNVFAHNRDDHLKNFTWIYDESQDFWRPSPAYDLTWSTTYFGEHTLTVNGNGQDPGIDELVAVGKQAGLNVKRCREIARKIQEITMPLEMKYRNIRS